MEVFEIFILSSTVAAMRFSCVGFYECNKETGSGSRVSAMTNYLLHLSREAIFWYQFLHKCSYVYFYISITISCRFPS